MLLITFIISFLGSLSANLVTKKLSASKGWLGTPIITLDNSIISSNEFKNLGLEYIEINLSMVDCMDKTLSNRIIRLMQDYDIDPKLINLEITESYDSLNNEISRDNIKKLEAYGINFSLDDYGTGYSNIERFSKFPIKIVKIDKSLVDEETDNFIKKNHV